MLKELPLICHILGHVVVCLLLTWCDFTKGQAMQEASSDLPYTLLLSLAVTV